MKGYEKLVYEEYKEKIGEISKEQDVDLSVATSMFLNNVDYMKEIYAPMGKVDYFKIQKRLKELKKESEKFGQ